MQPERTLGSSKDVKTEPDPGPEGGRRRLSAPVLKVPKDLVWSMFLENRFIPESQLGENPTLVHREMRKTLQL